MGHNRNLADYAHHFDGTNIDLGSGNIETDGVVTYEDVTNVDAIGIVTARAGVKIPDNQKVFLGTGDDLQIYHDGSNSYIDDTGTGRLNIRGNTGVSLRNYSDSEQFINCYTNGTVEIFYDNIKKLETTTTGAKVTGALEVTQEYPSIRPTIDFNFAATKTLDRRITFTRESVGTYIDENGLVKYASNNVPRFDHNPTTGESLGLLIEESRTNLLTYSDFVSGEGLGTGWAIGGNRASKGSNATAPDGTLSAWNSVYNGTSGDASLYKVGGEVTTSNSTAYTLSVFAKVPSTNTYLTGVRIRTFNDNHSATFNLLTGTIVGGVEGTTTRRMEAYPNGWYRCSITFTSGTDGNQGVQFYMTNSSNTTSMNDSNANGEEIHYWGAQMEAGSFPSSYIPTSGSSVTRAADNAKITGTNFTDWYNASEGTIFTESRLYTVTSTQNFTEIQIDDGTQSNRIFHYIAQSSDTGKFQAWGADVNVSGITVTPGTDFKHSSSYNSQSYITCLDGQLSPEGNTGTQVSLTEAKLGYNHSNNYLNGHIRKLSYYPKRLPNAQLQGLTQQ